ncbi:hypothetical protein [Daejeonella sp.]|uniref:hypothetical protein n=1 Tax=Daejeonella sp. TaxID=2805397 RepID=UPI002730D8F9|nr:hypothetical protein [Daejeonella sp.]MDP2413578.1 hypothetical protein [Daejeonella sp.]
MKTAAYNRFANRLADEIIISYNSLSATVPAEEYNSALIDIFIFSNNIQLSLRADNYKIPAHRQALIVVRNAKPAQ